MFAANFDMALVGELASKMNERRFLFCAAALSSRGFPEVTPVQSRKANLQIEPKKDLEMHGRCCQQRVRRDHKSVEFPIFVEEVRAIFRIERSQLLLVDWSFGSCIRLCRGHTPVQFGQLY